MTTERDIILNELAQGLRSMSQGIEWFDTHGPKGQAEILLFLRHHCVQARAVTEDGPESIRRAGLPDAHACGSDHPRPDRPATGKNRRPHPCR